MFPGNMSAGEPSGTPARAQGAAPDVAGTHHLSLVLALLPDVAQHVSELGLLLVHLIQAVLSILFLSLELLQTARFPV